MILLFCYSAALAQYKLDRALFKEGTSSRQNRGSSLTIVQREIWNGATEIGPLPGQHGATRVTNDGDATDTVMTNKDTLGFNAERLKVVADKPEKSGTLAMLMSAVLPGSGQIYVHRYITIPIIWGFGYYFAKSWVDQDNKYHAWSDSVAASVQLDSLKKGSDSFRTIRDFYRDDRDKFAFYIAIVYILNIVDAYVGASLYSFDVSDNLGGSAAIRFRIPLRYFRR